MTKNPGKVTIYPKQKKTFDKSPMKHKHAKKQASKPDSELPTIQNKEISNKRREKRSNIKAQKKDHVPVENATCLLLRNLPQSVSYNMLKNAIPTAGRMEIYKKGSKRHAFVNFESHSECKKAMKSVQGLVLDEHEVTAKFVSRKVDATKEPDTKNQSGTAPSIDKCITLSNLPFNITKPELEEEFPTASDIVLNLNKNGRFRGSCLLTFESADDCKVVWDACRGRKIGGRLLQCRAGAWFDSSRTNKVWGVKITGLPIEVTNPQLAALFPKNTLVKAHCELNAEKTSKTGLVRFSSADAQRAALKMLNKDEVFGVRVRSRPWVPQKGRASKPRLLAGEEATTQNETAPHTEKSLQSSEKKKRKHQSILSEGDSLNQPDSVTQDTQKSPGSTEKKKRKRQSILSEGDSLNQSNLVTPKKKKRSREEIDS